jgi:ribosomal-protein-alanine N-acetyltransferase
VLDTSESGGRGFVVRQMTAGDVPAIQKILQDSPGAAEWSEAGIRSSLENQLTIALASERGNVISGCIFGVRVGNEAEILSLAVSVSSRRKGEGTALVVRVLEEWEQMGVQRVFLEVRESNAGAIGFYTMLGFRQAGKRKKYYASPEEDALVLAREGATVIHRFVSVNA